MSKERSRTIVIKFWFEKQNCRWIQWSRTLTTDVTEGRQVLKSTCITHLWSGVTWGASDIIFSLISDKLALQDQRGQEPDVLLRVFLWPFSCQRVGVIYHLGWTPPPPKKKTCHLWSLTCFCSTIQIWRGNKASVQEQVEKSDFGPTVWKPNPRFCLFLLKRCRLVLASQVESSSVESFVSLTVRKRKSDRASPSFFTLKKTNVEWIQPALTSQLNLVKQWVIKQM